MRGEKTFTKFSAVFLQLCLLNDSNVFLRAGNKIDIQQSDLFQKNVWKMKIGFESERENVTNFVVSERIQNFTDKQL